MKEKNILCGSGLKPVTFESRIEKWAKGKTWKQLYQQCEDGSFLLWLFRKAFIQEDKLIHLIAGEQAMLAKCFMKDKESRKAVKVAIAFGRGKATKGDVVGAHYDANVANTHRMFVYMATPWAKAVLMSQRLKHWNAAQAAAAATSEHIPYEAPLHAICALRTDVSVPKKTADIFRAHVSYDMFSEIEKYNLINIK